MRNASSRSRTLRTIGLAVSLALTAAFVTTEQARGDEPAVAVGSEVILKDLTTNLRVENQVVPVKNHFRHYKVEQVNGDWVWLVSGHLKGWALKSEVVPAEHAIDFYTSFIERNPHSSSAYNLRGALWFSKKEYDIAIGDFSEAIRLNPKNFWAHNNRGNAYWIKKDYDRALADYNEAIRIDPRVASTYNNRGNVWWAKRDYARARADYEEATRRDPSFALAHGNLAYLHATCPEDEHRDGKKAVDAATRACEATHWKEANHLDSLAAAHAESGNFEAAVDWQKKALAALPEHRQDKVRFLGRLKLYQSKQPYREGPRQVASKPISVSSRDDAPRANPIP